MTKWEIRFVLTMLGFISVFFISGIVIVLAPVEWWVEYKEIEPLSSVNLLGQSIPFVTHLDVHHPVDVQYNDILRCKKGSTKEGSKIVWKWQGSQSTKHFTLDRSDGVYYGDWDFEKKNINLEHPDECVVESNTKVIVWPGITKALKPHYTKPFFVVKGEGNG